jgi:translation initiation factor 1 (eIF-1/SUI1)
MKSETNKSEQQTEEIKSETNKTEQQTTENQTDIAIISENFRKKDIMTLISSLSQLPTTNDKPYSEFLKQIRQVNPNNP